MSDRQPPTTPGRLSGTRLFAGVAAVLFAFVASGIVSYLNTGTLHQDARQVAHTHEILISLSELLSLMKDAETGQRGYVITGDDRYLEPYSAALPRIDQALATIERLTRDNPEHQGRLPALKENVHTKLRELGQSLTLRRTQGFDAARSEVADDRGKAAMDAIRSTIGTMQDAEQARRSAWLAEIERAYRASVGGGLLTGLLGILVTAAIAYLLRHAIRARQRREWLQTGQIGLSAAMVGDLPVEQLGQRVLQFLAEYLDALAGAFFAESGSGFRRVATYGVPADEALPSAFGPGDGLLGQAARDRRAFFVRDVPDGYLSFGSALGRGKPRHLVIAPFAADDAVKGVLELGFIHPLDELTLALLDTVSELIGVAVKGANYRAHLRNLLEETQRQAEELQTQREELRVSNEELEEQGRALKESQSRLEHQQSELEQSNAQLEEQTGILESQRDDLLRTKQTLQLQARELEQASRYKSDFLANMSHELRTPLNSSLILAKLLADNPEGNLSEEQVRYAATIQSAGNDLLVLINDILDLSKIESGRMEMRPEPVSLSQLLDDLRRTFEPIAAEKALTFRASVAPGCPETVETDRQRIEQVLRNLLSNAMKFTERGEVSLTASRAAGGRLALAVMDSGIGIPEHQHEMVFEAFRQADGTTNRKYGGTGLGLSISRELARLLGGDIHLASEPGRGSTFTLTVPEVYSPVLVRPRVTPGRGEQMAGEAAAGPVQSAGAAFRRERSNGLSAPGGTAAPCDDRERLTAGRRAILIVEDDESFARILCDLAHELDFECLVATTAEEALAMSLEYLPSALVLDVGLPDGSGLAVLDRLKHHSRTRHIPVHVVSAGDYAQAALSLGAVGYVSKPVKREDLAGALRQLEARLALRMRKVLVVEDDPVQLDSLRKLIGALEVETVGAGTAAECLEHLKATPFDCMVLDLSLPDASGYAILETLSREDVYEFPPVIVYTGRDLSASEEQRLRRYADSIIIKGAKSPERLLDEVTLFLHQVVSDLPPEQQRMLERARSRDAALEGRRILVVEDDVRNVFALTSILEGRGAVVQIARNGRESLEALEASSEDPARKIDLVLMDVMMPEMDGLTATREIRKRPEWKKVPVIMLTAKAMKDDQARCLEAGASDYMAKPLDVEKLLSLVRVWMPR